MNRRLRAARTPRWTVSPPVSPESAALGRLLQGEPTEPAERSLSPEERAALAEEEAARFSAFADAAVRGRPAELEVTMSDVIQGTLRQRRVEQEREVLDAARERHRP